MYAYTDTGFRAIAHAGDAVEGEQVSDTLPDRFLYPSFDDVVREAINGVQLWLDRTASQNGYDSAVSCASYAASGIPRYRADASAIIAWRDAVWTAANTWRNGLGGQMPNPVPTIEQIIGQLPQPRYYGWTVHDDGSDPGSETGEQS